ncbi:MAG: hypothetical protein NNA25_09170 [Nitrospira sp.]|nr:hypothetical protein [Nitrospira sp.]
MSKSMGIIGELLELFTDGSQRLDPTLGLDRWASFTEGEVEEESGHLLAHALVQVMGNSLPFVVLGRDESGRHVFQLGVLALDFFLDPFAVGDIGGNPTHGRNSPTFISEGDVHDDAGSETIGAGDGLLNL